MNRKTEYALMALQYFCSKPPGALIKVREIAEAYAIPEVLLAKIFQDLRRKEVLTSTRGASGGYTLATSLKEVSFLHFLNIFEQHTTVVQCASEDGHSCTRASSCMVKGPLLALNDVLTNHLAKLSIDDILHSHFVKSEVADTSPIS